MKKLYLISLLCLFFVQFGYSQAVPQGMKYQAVARDHAGEVLGNEKISLKISLYTTTDRSATTYIETHLVTTNQLGLFTLTIGNGTIESGEFSEVPWSTSDIWMEIAIKGREDRDFNIISASKMLSVPYAFHAATASELIGESGGRAPVPSPGVKSNRWEIVGNLGTVPGTPDFNKLGTMDGTDLVIVTSTRERMRLFAEGNIEMLTSLFIEDNLTVRQEVDLNSRSGSTRNHGPFTVTSQSPTWLTGILTVDGATSLNDKLTVFNQSPTLLSGTLTVDRATDLNSSLNVDGFTDLNSALFVNNSSPTLLSGKLLTMDDATFNEHVILDNSAYNSLTPTQGALVVDGGVGIGRNLTIGEDLKVIGSSTFEGPTAMATLKLSGTDQSTNTTTGALVVAGGVGIGKKMHVGGTAIFGNGTFNPNNYPLIVQGGTHGMAIKIAGSRSNANNFISFHDDHGQWGAIQGQTIVDYLTEPEYLVDKGFLLAEAVIATGELGVSIADGLIAGFELLQAAVELVAASTSSTGCVGLGACVTVPIPSFIVSNTTNVVLKTVNLVVSVVNTGLVIANTVIVGGKLITYEAFRIAQLGVTYESGSGDYAEWLPKEDPNEKFYPGDIIGVKGGYITKNTEGADYIMVISSRPIVLGNMPSKDNYTNFEKVAFMGQVPVKVYGNVEVGDYILPSGNHNGFGTRVAPENMLPEDYQKIVGIAWSASHSDHVGFINVAVGLNSNDVTRLVIDQGEKINNQQAALIELKDQVEEISELLVQLASGEDPALIAQKLQALNQTSPVPAEGALETHMHEKIVYYEVTREQILEGFVHARNILKSQGYDVDNHVFFKQLDEDPAKKERLIREIKGMIDNAALAQYEIDIKTGSIVEFDYEPVLNVNNGLQKELIIMGIEGAEETLKQQGVNTDEHPFFKKLKENPEEMENLVAEMQLLLNNKEQK